MNLPVLRFRSVARWSIAVLCASEWVAASAAQTALVVWGDSNWGQLNVPADLTNVVQVAAGWGHNLALRENGTVAAWGAGTNVQPTSFDKGQSIVPAGLSNVIAVAAGGSHSAALKSDGAVVVWGDNYYGLTNVPPGLTNVSAISAGANHMLALLADQTVAAWGLGATNDRFYPVYNQAAVPTGLSQVVAIAAGGDHSLALKADGTVVAWGRGSFGQTNVPTGLTNVIGIAAGGLHCLALQADGTIVGWGAGLTNAGGWPHHGQAVAPAGLSNVVFIRAGGYHSMAVTSDGTAVGWGENLAGQASPPAGLSGIRGLSCGNRHNLALVSESRPAILKQPTNQTAFDGQTVTISVQAAGVPLLGFQWERNGMAIASATNNSLVIRDVPFDAAGAYRVAVSNPFGTTLSDEATLVVVPSPPLILSAPTNMATYPGGKASFAIVCTGSEPLAYQWRFNGDDLPGATDAVLVLNRVLEGHAGVYSILVSNHHGTTSSFNVNLKLVSAVSWGPYGGQDYVPPDLTNVVALAAGGLHTLALKADGTMAAWGHNEAGQAEVPAGISNVVSIAAGGAHNLVLHANGRLSSWGSPGDGLHLIPISATNVVAIAAGNVFSLALRADGRVIAWGLGWYGATSVPADLTNAVAISASHTHHSLALRADGTVVAWGFDAAGAATVPPGLSNVVGIAAGNYHSLALKSDGTVVGWGPEAVIPPGVKDVVAIGAGWGFSIAMMRDRTAVCWGTSGPPEGLTNVVGIACGRHHRLALVEQRDAPPVLFSPGQSGNRFSASVPTVRGRFYALEFKDSLLDPNWTMLFPTPSDDTTKVLSDPDANVPTRIYRVRQWR